MCIRHAPSRSPLASCPPEEVVVVRKCDAREWAGAILTWLRQVHCYEHVNRVDFVEAPPSAAPGASTCRLSAVGHRLVQSSELVMW